MYFRGINIFKFLILISIYKLNTQETVSEKYMVLKQGTASVELPQNKKPTGTQSSSRSLFSSSEVSEFSNAKTTETTTDAFIHKSGFMARKFKSIYSQPVYFTHKIKSNHAHISPSWVPQLSF